MKATVKKYRHLQDIRAEVYIAAMIQNQSAKMDQFLVRPAGLFKRRFSKDMLEERIIQHNAAPQQYDIEIAREGLYDMLPEALFHNENQAPQQNEQEDGLRQGNKQKREETAARTFFLPLEQEFYRERVFIVMEEEYTTDLTRVDGRRKQDNPLLKFWDIDDKLFTRPQQSILLYLLPNVHKIVGDLPLTAAAYTLISGRRITIELRNEWENIKSEMTPASLSDINLGGNSVLGGQFQDGLPNIKIRIYLTDINEIQDFLEGGKELKKLNVLSGYLLPAGFPVEVQILLENQEQFESAGSENNYLGFMKI